MKNKHWFWRKPSVFSFFPYERLRRCMKSENTLFVLITLILLIETAAMSFLREYAFSGDRAYLLSGLLCYVLVSALLVQSFRYEGMGIVNTLWSAFSVIFVVVTGMVLFGERITVIEMTGITFSTIGVVIVRHHTGKKKMRGGRCLHVAAADFTK